MIACIREDIERHIDIKPIELYQISCIDCISLKAKTFAWCEVKMIYEILVCV